MNPSNHPEGANAKRLGISRREFLAYACGLTSALLASNTNPAGDVDLPQHTPWTSSPTPPGRTACCSGTGAPFGTQRV